MIVSVTVPPTSREPRPRTVTACASAPWSSKSRSFAWRHCSHSDCSCSVSMRCPACSRVCWTDARQGEVHVVAPEQDVVPHGHAGQREIAGGFRDRDEAEVGGAAPDVAHEHEVADADPLAPPIAHVIEPRVEGRLRLFEEPHRRETRLRGRLHGQFPCRLIEGGRHGHQDFLVAERDRPAVTMGPGVREVAQVPGGRLNGRQPRDLFGRLPGQDRGRPVDARVTQPRLGRRDEPAGPLDPTPAREFAHDRIGGPAPRQGGGLGHEVPRVRQIAEGRQQAEFRHLAGVQQLGDALGLDLRGLGPEIGLCEGAVGGPEVDADDESWVAHLTTPPLRPGRPRDARPTGRGAAARGTPPASRGGERPRSGPPRGPGCR